MLQYIYMAIKNKRAKKHSQMGPREIEDLVGCTLARRGKPARLGICIKCGRDFYTFNSGPFCSNKCSRFTTGDNGSGYLRITLEDGSRVYAHRHVAGAKKGEIVHHKNEDKKDNGRKNLAKKTQSVHCREHAPHIQRWGIPVSGECLTCGESRRLRRGYCNKRYHHRRYHGLPFPKLNFTHKSGAIRTV